MPIGPQVSDVAYGLLVLLISNKQVRCLNANLLSIPTCILIYFLARLTMSLRHQNQTSLKLDIYTCSSLFEIGPKIK